MILDLIVILLAMIAGISKAIMDKLLFHFDNSVFLNNKFWNPKDSWNNKWKNGIKENGERFFLSSTVLSFTTDAWHLFQSFFLNSLMVAFALFGYFNDGGVFLFIYKLILLIIITKTTFELYFKHYLNKDLVD